jgi:hypothetical protein
MQANDSSNNKKVTMYYEHEMKGINLNKNALDS